MKILIISTSLAPDSHSRACALALRASALKLEERDVEIDLVDLRDHPLPLCGGDACWADPAVVALQARIQAADGLALASPVYNYDASAAAKNLIELTGEAWSDKIVGLICAAGGRSSYMSLMGLANSLMLDFRCVIIPRFVYVTADHFDEAGALADDDILQRVDALARALIQMTRALRP